MNRNSLLILLLLLTNWIRSESFGQTKNQADTAWSGNPLFKGWYADPEGIIYGKQYWIYPTYPAPYNQQVFFDAFSSNDLVKWTRHERIRDTSSIKWARRRCGSTNQIVSTLLKKRKDELSSFLTELLAQTKNCCLYCSIL